MINNLISKVTSFFTGTVADVLQAITVFIFRTIIQFVIVILKPLNAIIVTAIPGTDVLIDYISSFFEYISNLIPWVVSYLGLDPALLNLIVGFIVFRISTTLLVNMIKFGLNWYKALKP